MEINKICNFLEVKEITSKDGKNKYHHATFVVDDIVVNCNFIKQTDYDILKGGQRLAEVAVVFNLFQSGTDNGNAVYSLRLSNVNGWIVPENETNERRAKQRI